MVTWLKEFGEPNPTRECDIVFCMALGDGTFYGAAPLELPAFNVTETTSEEKPSAVEEAFAEECKKYDVSDYRLLRACILYDCPGFLWKAPDLWASTMSFIKTYVEDHDWVKKHVLDFNEDDILIESKIKLTDGAYKTFTVGDINMEWLEWLDARQEYPECAEVLRAMFDYMKRFKELPTCLRLVDTDHVKHAYRMKRWCVDSEV